MQHWVDDYWHWQWWIFRWWDDDGDYIDAKDNQDEDKMIDKDVDYYNDAKDD